MLGFCRQRNGEEAGAATALVPAFMGLCNGRELCTLAYRLGIWKPNQRKERYMIAYYTEANWHIVTQRSHGLLAGQICAAWRHADRPIRWVETLIAAAEHDDVFNEFARNPLVDSNGAPVNFKEMVFDRDASEQLMSMSVAKSRFIALLIYRHIRFTHGSEPSSKAFLKSLQEKEQKWVAEAGTSAGELDQAYALLEFCDAFSLLVCQGIIPPEGRAVEISSGPDGTPHTVRCLKGALVVEPWPFQDEEFRISYECRKLAKLKFGSDRVLREALEEASVELVTLPVMRMKPIG